MPEIHLFYCCAVCYATREMIVHMHVHVITSDHAKWMPKNQEPSVYEINGRVAEVVAKRSGVVQTQRKIDCPKQHVALSGLREFV